MSLEIETGVAYPCPDSHEVTQTLRALEVGQSVLIPGWKATQSHRFVKLARQGTEKRFAAKTMTTGARIWRME
jgi:hypothetical protein